MIKQLKPFLIIFLLILNNACKGQDNSKEHVEELQNRHWLTQAINNAAKNKDKPEVDASADYHLKMEQIKLEARLGRHFG